MKRRAREHPDPVRPDPEGVMRLVFDGEPRSKANAGKVWRGQYRQPSWVRRFEDGIRLRALVQCQALGYREFPVFAGGVRVTYRFYFKRNPTNRDLDNMRKSVNDALQGIVYKNDSQIWADAGEKFHDKDNPRIEMEVNEYELP
jgi:Holliday junction resolvase RusA-like endonuclease